jgi:hybrid cluster-associated redox disulfide protein
LRQRKDRFAEPPYLCAVQHNGPKHPLLDLLVSDLLERWPAAARGFRKAGLAACIGCAIAPFDTLEAAIRIHGLDAGRVLQELLTYLPGEAP